MSNPRYIRVYNKRYELSEVKKKTGLMQSWSVNIAKNFFFFQDLLYNDLSRSTQFMNLYQHLGYSTAPDPKIRNCGSPNYLATEKGMINI